MAKLRRIGILGGSFNPVHLGHLVLAEQARQILDLEKVIFIPANLAPHKDRRALSPAEARCRMLALALKSNPDFELSDIELKRGGVSYSIETVKRLKAIYPQSRLYFIVGSDFLREFLTWKDIAALGKICKFVIAQRPGFAFKKPPRSMRVIEISGLEISSSAIRKRIKSGKSIRYLVPELARRYILKKKLYR